MFNSTEHEVSELLEHMSFTLSQKFVEKWRYKYPSKLITFFQTKLLHAWQVKKPIKKATLSSQLVKRGRVSNEVVLTFFEDIDIVLYYPVIQ